MPHPKHSHQLLRSRQLHSHFCELHTAIFAELEKMFGVNTREFSMAEKYEYTMARASLENKLVMASRRAKYWYASIMANRA